MINFLLNFNELCKESLEKYKIKLPKNYKNIDNIVISGMGGSAIIGDVFLDIFGKELKIPIFINRSYELPNFASEKTLLIVVSYSGNTLETLKVLKEGLKRKCKIVGITSDGKMLEIHKRKKLPYIEVEKNLVPRFSFVQMFFALVNVFISLGLIKVGKFEIEKINLEEVFVVVKKIKGKNVLIVSNLSSVARRFKSQLNENAKVIARFEEIPEMFHNEIESWKNLSDNDIVILIRDEKSENKEIKKSFEFIKKVVKNYVEIKSKGKNKLERILYLIWYVDLVSYYLALELKVDPLATEMIKKYKEYVYSD